LDESSSHQAETDEKGWAQLADDLMDEDEDSLLGICGRPLAMDSTAALAKGPADPDRSVASTMNQKTVPASPATVQREEYRDEDGSEVDYSSEEKPGSPTQSGAPTEIQNIITPVEIQNIITPVEIQNIITPVEVQNSIKPVAVQNSIKPVAVQNIIKPLAETPGDSMSTAAEIQVVLAECKPDSSGPPSGSTIQSPRIDTALTGPQPTFTGSKEESEVFDTRQAP
jgi:hypothetical protein